MIEENYNYKVTVYKKKKTCWAPVLYLVIKWRHETLISFIFKLWLLLNDKLLKVKLYSFILANNTTIKMYY